MPIFALVAEGVTDHAVIERILQGWFDTPSDSQDLSTNSLQPLRDATGEHGRTPQAGWETVLEYCASDHITEALAFNDYLVIHIDTDEGDHVNYGVALTKNGKDRSVADIVEAVIEKIEYALGDQVCNEFADRIIYAIAVHSTECWLLAHHAHSNSKARVKNCLEHLQRTLATRDWNITKTYKSYSDVAKPLASRKDLLKAADRSESLQYFICALQVAQNTEA